jgi:hypothetical protein
MAILDSGYTYAQYLSDIAGVFPYLGGAIIAVLLRSLVRGRNGNGKPAAPPHDR